MRNDQEKKKRNSAHTTRVRWISILALLAIITLGFLPVLKGATTHRTGLPNSTSLGSVNPTISGISLLSSEVKYETATLSEKAEEPGVLECAGPRVFIKPSKAGIRYYVSAQYTFEFPDHFYYTLHFGHPTIGVLLSMNAPPDFIVSASPTPVSDGHSWEYQKLFMTQEYLTVRWRRDGVQSAETGHS